MTDSVLLLVFLAVGAVLGVFYFGGLWLTVRRVTDSDRPKLLLLGSFLVRTLIVLAGFYSVLQIMGPHWEWLAVSLVGFLGMRFLLVRRWRPDPALSSSTDPLTNT